jgi:hypothetical protein
MEAMRPAVDQQVLAFALSQTFHPGDYHQQSGRVSA